MKRLVIMIALMGGLAACDNGRKAEEDIPDPVDVIDATNLTDIMLTVSDPEEAVNYFRGALSREPDRLEYRRGLASSLVKAGQYAEAALIYERIIENGDANIEDRLYYAETLVRENEFEAAAAQLEEVPNSRGGARKNVLLGMIADQDRRWADADAYYRLARSQTNRPAQVLNNWGVSMMSRGDLTNAQKTFQDAITFDPKGFEAKNNLVLARGLEGNYNLPVIPLSEEERATLLHNLAVLALRRNEVSIAKGLLEHAVETHPRYYSAAAEKLEALQSVVVR